MTRIISGEAGGRRLAVPSGTATRPTSDRVREGIFSRLEHLDALTDAVVLDLYAGSGALGLEAASRGARLVTLVDQDRAAVTAARRNVAELGWRDRVTSARSAPPQWPEGWEDAGDRRYGETRVWFASVPSDGDAA